MKHLKAGDSTENLVAEYEMPKFLAISPSQPDPLPAHWSDPNYWSPCTVQYAGQQYNGVAGLFDTRNNPPTPVDWSSVELQAGNENDPFIVKAYVDGVNHVQTGMNCVCTVTRPYPTGYIGHTQYVGTTQSEWVGVGQMGFWVVIGMNYGTTSTW